MTPAANNNPLVLEKTISVIDALECVPGRALQTPAETFHLATPREVKPPAVENDPPTNNSLSVCPRQSEVPTPPF